MVIRNVGEEVAIYFGGHSTTDFTCAGWSAPAEKSTDSIPNRKRQEEIMTSPSSAIQRCLARYRASHSLLVDLDIEHGAVEFHLGHERLGGDKKLPLISARHTARE